MIVSFFPVYVEHDQYYCIYSLKCHYAMVNLSFWQSFLESHKIWL